MTAWQKGHKEPGNPSCFLPWLYRSFYGKLFCLLNRQRRYYLSNKHSYLPLTNSNSYFIFFNNLCLELNQKSLKRVLLPKQFHGWNRGWWEASPVALKPFILPAKRIPEKIIYKISEIVSVYIFFWKWTELSQKKSEKNNGPRRNVRGFGWCEKVAVAILNLYHILGPLLAHMPNLTFGRF